MEGSSETGRRSKVKGCLGSWKGAGESTHIVRLGHQRAFQSVEDASDPGLDWVSQKLERTQKTGWPSRSTCLFVFKKSPPILRGASETGGRPTARRAAGNLKRIG